MSECSCGVSSTCSTCPLHGVLVRVTREPPPMPPVVSPRRHYGDDSNDGTVPEAVRHVRGLLRFVGEDPERGGLLETPLRVVKAWKEWCAGYWVNVADLLKTFEDGAENVDTMVVVRDIPFYSHCEHHMAPFFGTASVGYIPTGKIVGLSKLSRVVDAYARRLQVQERLTHQIGESLHTHLKPLGVGVVLRARHLCMESRGVRQQGHSTQTSALFGVFRDEPETRAEFFNMINNKG